MIPLLALQSVIRVRYPAPVIFQGRPVRQEPEEEEIRANIQPVPDSNRNWQNSGYNIDRLINIISYSDFQAGEQGGIPGDRIEFDDRVYEVISAKKMPSFLNQPAHWEAVAYEVQPIAAFEPTIPEEEDP